MMTEFNCNNDHEKVIESITGTGAKIDYMFSVIRDALRNKNRAVSASYIDLAEKESLKGGDWERKNKLSVYKGVLALYDRNLKTAADIFVKSLATFTPCELLSFKDFVFYTVITSMISLDRTTLMQKILESPEILTVVGEIPRLREFLVALCECHYKDFFNEFAFLIDSVRTDPYLGMHVRYITRALRLVSYKQFLLPYKSVTMDMMASAFGVTPEFIEEELSDFISAGKLNCKIDRINGVVESNRMEDSRNVLYGRVIKTGDILLNQLQKLSRVIDV